MSDHPLAEVFGFPPTNGSPVAKRHRDGKLCPFNNKVAQCTKDKIASPLGVCSIRERHGGTTITCPIRFRQGWIIAKHAADYFFDEGATWKALTEVRLVDMHGKSAGNIDIVLVEYDEAGSVIDFGALEVQAVYISGNIRNPFEYFMDDPVNRASMDWTSEDHYPHADYLSSSRKRLVPQLLFKSGILQSWGKKSAVAMTRSFFDTLPPLAAVDQVESELAWFIYDLVWHEPDQVFVLERVNTIYTKFEDALMAVSTSDPGHVDDFIGKLQVKLDSVLG